jgi:hypothetical protein
MQNSYNCNIVAQTVEVFAALGSTQAHVTRWTPVDCERAMVMLDTLTEYMQGPCPGNQELLAQSIFPEICVFIISSRLQVVLDLRAFIRRCDEHEKDLEQARRDRQPWLLGGKWLGGGDWMDWSSNDAAGGVEFGRERGEQHGPTDTTELRAQLRDLEQLDKDLKAKAVKGLTSMAEGQIETVMDALSNMVEPSLLQARLGEVWTLFEQLTKVMEAERQFADEDWDENFLDEACDLLTLSEALSNFDETFRRQVHGRSGCNSSMLFVALRMRLACVRMAAAA